MFAWNSFEFIPALITQPDSSLGGLWESSVHMRVSWASQPADNMLPLDSDWVGLVLTLRFQSWTSLGESEAATNTAECWDAETLSSCHQLGPQSPHLPLWAWPSPCCHSQPKPWPQSSTRNLGSQLCIPTFSSQEGSFNFLEVKSFFLSGPPRNSPMVPGKT